MTPFITIISSGVASFISCILGFFILSKDWRRSVNRSFGGLLLVTSFWMLFYSIWQTTVNKELSLLLVRITMVGAIFTYPFLVYFVVSFTKIKRGKWIIILSFLSAALLAIFSLFNNFFIKDAQPILGYSYWPVPGWAFHFYVFIWFIVVFYSFVSLYYFYKNNSVGLARLQIIYVFIGLLISFLGGATNFFLWYRIPISPWGNFLVPIYSLFIGYAIVRYRLMDIKVVIKRSTIFTLLVLILTAIYSFLIILISKTFGDVFGGYSQIATSLIVSILVVIGFQPLKLIIQKTTRRFLFKEEYDPQEIIAELSSDLASSLELKHLFEDVGGIIDRVFHPKRSGIFLLDKKSEYYLPVDVEGFNDVKDKANLSFSLLDPLIVYLKEHREIIVAQELQRKTESNYVPDIEKVKILLERMGKTGGEVFLPLFSKDVLIGIFILGEKKSGDIYTTEDIRLLEIGGAQAAVAIENAQMYSEVKNFNLTLQEEVDKATKELRLANDRLKKLDEAKSDFISIASHQLRTPLTVIKGYISMMLEGSFGQLNEQELDSLHKVYESNQRLINLVEDLLNISRIESGRIQYTWETKSMEALAQSVVEELAANAKKKKIALDYIKPEKTLPKIRMDEDKMRQVFMNLVDNSIKYTSKGGVHVSVLQKGRNIIFQVADSGMGIDPGDKPNLFQKFSRGKGMSKVHTEGTGLGLFVAKEIIKAHGGKIWAESEGKNRGSIFSVSLPLMSGKAVEEDIAAGELKAIEKLAEKPVKKALSPAKTAKVKAK